jgi:stage IV sporulation protein FB
MSMFDFFSFGSKFTDQPQGRKAFHLRGIPVYIENGFWLFLSVTWLLMLYWQKNLVDSLIFCLVIFISLLGHEAGHAFAARHFKLYPIHISLVMFGGYVRHPATQRGRSLIITLAGPAISFALCLAGLILGSSLQNNGTVLMGHFLFLCHLMFILNLFWGLFNMLPIFPMDGGKACLYAFCYRFDDQQAMLRTAWLSLGTILVITPLALIYTGSILIILFLAMFGHQNYQIIKSLRSPWG